MRHFHAVKGRESGEYRSWQSMIQRCTNPRATGYEKYGARGVTVCREWRENFHAFLRDTGPRPPGTSLDRIDGSRGYEPGNVRWADPKTQNQNRRSAHLVTIDGETACIAEWSRRAGVSDTCILHRLRRGWSGRDLLLPGHHGKELRERGPAPKQEGLALAALSSEGSK